MTRTKMVLVTGGCGFVGRHLVRNLFKKGYTIWIVDDLSTGWHPDRWLPFEIVSEKKVVDDDTFQRVIYGSDDGEITFFHVNAIEFFYSQVQSRPERMLELPEFDEVYHLASIVGGRQLIEGDPMLVATDLAIDSLFFLWVTRNIEHFNRIQFASSSAAYPIHLQTESDNVPLSEDYIQFNEHLGIPDLTYGWSKLTGEYLARTASEQYGLATSCVRPFSGYGEDQDLTYPVPAIANRIAKREDPVIVWGTGKQSRDFVHIDDVVEAMQLIAQKVSNGCGINIGSGKPTSFIEIIRILCDIEGYSPRIKPLVEKPVGVQARYANITKMTKVLKWRPKISLREGLERVLRYQKKIIHNEGDVDE